MNKIKKIAIIQPNYIPWIGYFEIIKYVDIFVFLDDVQFTKRDWRNRNYILDQGEKKILTIPVRQKGKYYQSINDVIINDMSSLDKHLLIIKNAYKNSINFDKIFTFLEDIYNKHKSENLSEFAINITIEICNFLGISKKFYNSSDLKCDGKNNAKLINICNKLGCRTYISGPSAFGYLDTNMFKLNQINLKICNYKMQKKYTQIDNRSFFVEKLSIIDLLFNVKVTDKYIQKIGFIKH